MVKRSKKHKCKNCHVFFPPDPRNAWHQEYCSKPECRKASKAASQKRWLQNEESQDYFRGPLNIQRVQEWRKSHPGYWRRKSSEKKEPALSAAEPAEPRKAAFASLEGEPLQDLLIEKPSEYRLVAQPLPSTALQDLLSSQLAVLIGLIAHMSGTALQDDIVLTACHLQQLGNAITVQLRAKEKRMIEKHPICPQRIRKLPGQFSWVDHRLVRDRYIESCSHPAATLYLFLLTVADSLGLSYYSDASIMIRLSMDEPTLNEARKNLIGIELIAYKRPLYQVLSLDPLAHAAPPAVASTLDKPVSIGEIFKQMRDALHD